MRRCSKTSIIKTTSVLLVFVCFTVIFELISSRCVFETKVLKERLPNRTLYHEILFRHVELLNFTSPSIHEDTKVIVVVCTKPNDFRVRNTIRRTWASPHHSNAIQEKIFTVMFLLGAGYLTGPIKQEMSTYKDILQVDVEDSYSNLIYKMLAVYRWIAANHPDKYVLKVDSDVVVLLDKVKEIVSDPTERSIKCLVNHHAPVQRNISHRWYIPESAYSKHYLPDYCNGPLYLMTPAALKSVLDVILNAKFFEVEDAFFTGVLAEIAGVRVQNQRGIWDRQKSSQPCVGGKGTVIGFPTHSAGGVLDLVKSWDHLRSIRCRFPIEHFIMSLIVRD